MAKKKKYTKSDEEIVNLVDIRVRNSASWYESKLSKERELVTQYYNGTKPARQHQGSSTFISSDVYDAVEMMKAQLLETFASGRDIVRFDPVGPEDSEMARVCTAYTNHMIFDRSNGYCKFNDIIHDGLTARVGVAKVYWDETWEEDHEEFEDLPEDQIQGLAADDAVTTLEAEANEDGSYSGTLVRQRSTSKLGIDVIPPEEFLIEEQAVSIEKADIKAHRTLKTKSELLKMGYPKSKVNKLTFEEIQSVDLSLDAQARREATDGQNQLVGRDISQDALQQTLLYETYMMMELEKDGEARLYRVVHAGTQLFEIEPVDRSPFMAFTPLPIPHIFYGNNFAHRVIPYQTARTALTRGVLDHTAITNNPRMQVLKGGLLNPRELLDNRLGGLVNVNRQDALSPMPQAPLNPFVYQTINMMKEGREETTGISSLSQGLNKDAISKQNSSDLIEKMVSVSQQRQKIIARNFATFLKELWLRAYALIIENENQKKIFDYTGSYVEVNPSDWMERKDVTVSMHLGYGEQEKEASKYVNLYHQLASDASIAPMFTIEKKRKLIADATSKNGITNIDDYLIPAEEAKPPGPDPLKMKELEIKEMSAKAALMSAQSHMSQIQSNERIAMAKIDMDKLKLGVTSDQDDRDNARHDAETVNRIDVSQRELELAEKVPPEGQRGIFSANS